MKILENLDREHRLLESAAGSMVAIARQWAENDTEEIRSDMRDLMGFFTEFMVQYHTKKEEDVIFSALEKQNLPRKTGPLHFYEMEHGLHLERANELLALANSALSPEQLASIPPKAVAYCAEIWEHIDKEDSVLFREVNERIRGLQINEIDEEFNRYMANHPPDQSLIEIAENLIKKYPPVTVIPDVFRGDGCMICRFFGAGCDGIEHEWWTENEWEDFFERNDRD